MKKLLVLSLIASLFTACSDKGGGKLDEISKLTKEAKKSMDFIKIKTECGLLETKNAELAKDQKFKEVCQVAPLFARAKLAMAEGAGSNNCEFVKMDIESAIQKGIEAERMQKLLADVKSKCGG